jgi:hypothetical protein
LYTRAEDTVDPDDLIFPKAATRVGTKFQANVPSWEEQQQRPTRWKQGLRGTSDVSIWEGRALIRIVERGHDNGERKHESTIDVLSTPSTGRE